MYAQENPENRTNLALTQEFRVFYGTGTPPKNITLIQTFLESLPQPYYRLQVRCWGVSPKGNCCACTVALYNINLPIVQGCPITICEVRLTGTGCELLKQSEIGTQERNESELQIDLSDVQTHWRCEQCRHTCVRNKSGVWGHMPTLSTNNKSRFYLPNLSVKPLCPS